MARKPRMPAPLLKAGAGILAAACGSCASSSTPPEPAPTTAPQAFVHLLQANALSTFEIVEESGSLVLRGTMALPGPTGARYLAADPLGRFLYVSEPSSGIDHLSSHAVDAKTGAVRRVSEVSVPDTQSARRVTASERLVFLENTGYAPGHHTGFYWSVFSVDEASGALKDCKQMQGAGLSHSELGVEPKGPFVYQLLADHTHSFAYKDQVESFVVDAESGFQRVAMQNLPYQIWSPTDSALVGGVFVVSYADDEIPGGLLSFVVDRDTGRISPPARFPEVGADKSYPTRLAAAGSSRLLAATKREVRLYSVDPSGTLRLDDALAWEEATSLAAHPSGRFFYASQPRGIAVYEIGPDAHIRDLGNVPGFSGTLVVAPIPR